MVQVDDVTITGRTRFTCRVWSRTPTRRRYITGQNNFRRIYTGQTNIHLLVCRGVGASGYIRGRYITDLDSSAHIRLFIFCQTRYYISRIIGNLTVIYLRYLKPELTTLLVTVKTYTSWYCVYKSNLVFTWEISIYRDYFLIKIILKDFSIEGQGLRQLD